MRFSLVLIALLATGSFLAGEARAVGMTGHELISLMIQRKATGSLKKLLDQEQDSYRNGTIFPDVAAAYLTQVVEWNPEGRYSADDLSHGLQDGKPGGMVNEYLAKIKNDCGLKYKESESAECRQARAFFIGMVSHLIADAPWHADFIGLAETKKGLKSLKNHCTAEEDVKGKAHNLADTDFDICLSKVLNSVPNPNLHFTTKKKATFKRKNTYVAQGCPEDQWWHVGGGDGLLGACWKCPAGYEHDSGKNPDQAGVCYKERTIACDKIDLKELDVDLNLAWSVTASALGFQVVETGYGYAAAAYNSLDDKTKSKNIGKKTSKQGLIEMVNSDEFLPNLTFSQHASVVDFKDKLYAAECDWGMRHALSAEGGILVSRSAARDFIDYLWEYMQTEQDFAVVRFGAYNYALLKGGAPRHCVFQNAADGCT